MGITNLSTFGGQAEVLGHPKNFLFEDGVLAIEDLSLEDAKVILEVLAKGELNTVPAYDATQDPAASILRTKESGSTAKPATATATPSETEPTAEEMPAEDPPTEEPPQETKGDGEGKGKKAPASKGRRRGARKSKNTSAEAPATEAAPAEEAPPPSDADAPNEEPAAKTAPEEAAEEPAEEAATEGGDDLLKAVQGETRLRSIIGVLVEAGCDSHAKLIEKCTELKPNVPLLEKCANLEDRIPRLAGGFGVDA